MGKVDQRTARKHIISMYRAGVPVEQLAKAAPHELGVRPRFVYRVLGFEYRYNPVEHRMEWVEPMEGT